MLSAVEHPYRQFTPDPYAVRWRNLRMRQRLVTVLAAISTVPFILGFASKDGSLTWLVVPALALTAVGNVAVFTFRCPHCGKRFSKKWFNRREFNTRCESCGIVEGTPKIEASNSGDGHPSRG